MDDIAIFNRSVWGVTGLAHDEWRTVGDNAHGRLVSEPLAGSIKGQMWLLLGRLSNPDRIRSTSIEADAFPQRLAATFLDLLISRASDADRASRARL
jgi:hypothetical protein